MRARWIGGPGPCGWRVAPGGGLEPDAEKQATVALIEMWRAPGYHCGWTMARSSTWPRPTATRLVSSLHVVGGLLASDARVVVVDGGHRGHRRPV
jgi:hypothetical protein